MRPRAPISSGSRPSELGDANFPALKPLDSYRGTSAEQWVTTSSVDTSKNQVTPLTFHFSVYHFCMDPALECLSTSY